MIDRIRQHAAFGETQQPPPLEGSDGLLIESSGGSSLKLLLSQISYGCLKLFHTTEQSSVPVAAEFNGDRNPSSPGSRPIRRVRADLKLFGESGYNCKFCMIQKHDIPVENVLDFYFGGL